MSFYYENINCQNPASKANIFRTYKVVKAVLNKTDSVLQNLQAEAWNLAMQVNPRRANNATTTRDKERLILDALGGIIAEKAWIYYINRIYGEGVAKVAPFVEADGQIDILLSNGKYIEVRSSFPRNGVKFAICNARYNFKNICKYDNLYKPSEVDKDFFAAVLFETTKEQLLDKTVDTVLYLIGGSTKQMMLDETLSFDDALIAENELSKSKTKTNYRVIYLKDALDMDGFANYMQSMGFQIKHQLE